MKIIDVNKAVDFIKDDMTIMIGGFMCNGTPEILIDELVKKKVKNLTVICNDAGVVGKGVAKLIEANMVKHLMTSHIGLNPMAGEKMRNEELKITLIPQGTLAEQIRSSGAGLGGVLTPTGLGTSIEEGKDEVEIDGKVYILEKPLKADVALIRGSIVNEKGNIFYKGTTRNFNPIMATACKIVLVAAEKLVFTGSIEGENIHTPATFVDYIVKGEPKHE